MKKLFALLLLLGCDGGFCFDRKQCPSMCQVGSVCKAAQLIEFGGATTYHCVVVETKAALQSIDAGICDEGVTP